MMKVFKEIDNYFNDKSKKEFFYVIAAVLLLIGFIFFYYVYPIASEYKIKSEKKYLVR